MNEKIIVGLSLFKVEKSVLKEFYKQFKTIREGIMNSNFSYSNVNLVTITFSIQSEKDYIQYPKQFGNIVIWYHKRKTVAVNIAIRREDVDMLKITDVEIMDLALKELHSHEAFKRNKNVFNFIKQLIETFDLFRLSLSANNSK